MQYKQRTILLISLADIYFTGVNHDL